MADQDPAIYISADPAILGRPVTPPSIDNPLPAYYAAYESFIQRYGLVPTAFLVAPDQEERLLRLSIFYAVKRWKEGHSEATAVIVACVCGVPVYSLNHLPAGTIQAAVIAGAGERANASTMRAFAASSAGEPYTAQMVVHDELVDGFEPPEHRWERK